MNFSKIICSICAIAGLTQISGYAAIPQNTTAPSRPSGFTERVQTQRALSPNVSTRATTSTNPEGSTVKTLRNQSTGGNTALTLGPDGVHVNRIRMQGGLFTGFSALATVTPEGNWNLALSTPTQELQGTLTHDSIGENGTMFTYNATNVRNVSVSYTIAQHADGGVVVTDRGTGNTVSYTPAEVTRLLDSMELPSGGDTLASAVPMVCLGQFLKSAPSITN